MQLADNGLSVKRESDNLVINRHTSIMELLMLTDNDKAASDWQIIPSHLCQLQVNKNEPLRQNQSRYCTA